MNSKLQFNLKNYFHEYEKFVDQLNLKNKMLISKKTDNIISYKKYTSFTESGLEFDEKDVFYSTVYYITLDLGKYLNQLVYSENKNYQNFIIKDITQRKTIKIPYRFYDNNVINNEIILLPPLMPVRF